MTLFAKPALCFVAVLLFCGVLRLPAVDLKVDFNDRDAANNTPGNTEGGFQSMTMATSPANAQSIPTSATFGTQTVTITATGTYDDRKRTLPVNGGTFTQQALLQDFIFAVYTGANPTAGLDISVGGLVPGRQYLITVWSFDDESNGTRVSNWSVNGLIGLAGYTFDGRITADTNERYQIPLEGSADGTGKLLISGRRDPASVDGVVTPSPSHGVYLNALWVRDRFDDNDHDGMSDGWEETHGLNSQVNDTLLDPDNDTLSNLGEYTAGTNPQDPDSDDDTFLDGYEKKTGIWAGVTNTGTDPALADTDKDGLSDTVENPDLPFLGPTQSGTNPNLYDSDGDGFSDNEELTWSPPTHPRDGNSYPNPEAGGTLLVDFENIAARVQPGFQAFLGTGNVVATTSLSTTYGPYSVTIGAVGSTDLKSRDRDVAAGGMGFNALFRDFIFADGGADENDGLDVTITGLAPDTTYPVSLWSWDPSSISPARRSTWSASDGAAIAVKVPAYVLNSDTLPTTLEDRRMKFYAKTDAVGKLIIQGRKEAGYVPNPVTPVHVILNGLVIGAPLTPPRFTAITGGQFTFTSDDIGVYEVRSSPNLLQWTTIAPAVDGQVGTTTFTDPAPSAARLFYQVRRVSP